MLNIDPAYHETLVSLNIDIGNSEALRAATMMLMVIASSIDKLTKSDTITDLYQHSNGTRP
jgi:hypothetical protein